MEAAFIKHLSMENKHYRFFGAVKELSATEVHRLCSTDGLHDMAFVATVQKADTEIEIGVCRYASDSKEDVRELAVTISDEWQHMGLGQLLITQLIATARQFGVHQLYSSELADNTMMRDLAKELGMTASRDPRDARQVVYCLTL